MRVVGIFSLLLVAGCVDQSVVYERSLHPAYLSPMAQRLSRAEFEQIAHLMADRTRQSIVAIEGAPYPKHHGQLIIYTSFPGGSQRGDFGYWALAKENGSWRIMEGGEDADPVLMQTIGHGL